MTGTTEVRRRDLEKERNDFAWVHSRLIGN